tara:strand:- start:696 stop:914 length:219 start_codon:yes stop_codon:yes gene_type:complete
MAFRSKVENELNELDTRKRKILSEKRQVESRILSSARTHGAQLKVLDEDLWEVERLIISLKKEQKNDENVFQ